jgi:hypothetical protein
MPHPYTPATPAECQAARTAVNGELPPEITVDAPASANVSVPVGSKDIATTDDAPVRLIWFRPEHLYVCPVTWELDHVRVQKFVFVDGAERHVIACTWEQLGRRLSRSTEGNPRSLPDDPNMAKRAAGAWVPGTFTGTVGHADLPSEFLSTEILVVDIDAGDPHAVAEVLAPYQAIIHSTFKHAPEKPRCRAVLRLACACTSAVNYNIGEHAVAEFLNSKGFTCPAGDSTLGKLAYLPMHAPGVKPIHIVTHGRPLDLDRLVRADEQRRQAHPTTRNQATWQGSPHDHAGAIRRAAEHVAAAPPGERHNARRKWARWLAEIGVHDDVIRRACLDADSDKTACKTVEWAIKKGRQS